MWVRFALIAASAVAWHVRRKRGPHVVEQVSDWNSGHGIGKTDDAASTRVPKRQRDAPRIFSEPSVVNVNEEVADREAEGERSLPDLNDIVDIFCDGISSAGQEVPGGSSLQKTESDLARATEKFSAYEANESLRSRDEDLTDAASVFLATLNLEESDGNDDDDDDLDETLSFLGGGKEDGETSSLKDEDERQRERQSLAELKMMLRSWKEKEKDYILRHEEMKMVHGRLWRETVMKASTNMEQAQKLMKGVEEHEMGVQKHMETLKEIREEEDTFKSVLSEFRNTEAALAAEVEERKARIEEMETKLEKFRKALSIREERKATEVDTLVRKLLELDGKERENERVAEKLNQHARHRFSIMNQQAEAERKQEQDLEKKVTSLRDLESQIEQMSSRSNELSVACEKMVKLLGHLVAECEKLGRTPESEVLTRLEEGIATQEELNKNLKGKVDELQDTHFSDMGEIVYLRWMNACLRFELHDFEPSSGKVSAAKLNRSRSPRSWEAARSTLLEYAGPQFVSRRAREIAERKKDGDGLTQEREEAQRERSGEQQGTTKQKKRKFIGRLRLWGGRDGTKASETSGGGRPSPSPTHTAGDGGWTSPRGSEVDTVGMEERDGEGMSEKMGDLYSPVSSSGGSFATSLSGLSGELSLTRTEENKELSFVAAYKALSKAMVGSDVDKKYPPFRRAQELSNPWGRPTSSSSTGEEMREDGNEDGEEEEPGMQSFVFMETEKVLTAEAMKVGRSFPQGRGFVPIISARKTTPRKPPREKARIRKPPLKKKQENPSPEVREQDEKKTNAKVDDKGLPGGEASVEVGGKKTPRVPTAPPKPSAPLPTAINPPGLSTPGGGPPPAPPAPPPFGSGKGSPSPFMPPPPPSMLGFGGKGGFGLAHGPSDPKAVRKTPQVIELYQTLMKRDTKKDNLALAAGVETVAMERRGEMIMELEKRSSHVKAVMTDVKVQAQFVNALAGEVRQASFSRIENIVEFVKWMDEELAFLVDERAVLKHFDWPEMKADALREAAFDFKGLTDLENEVLSCDADRDHTLSNEETWRKMSKLLDRMETTVYALLRKREAALQRFVDFKIPSYWLQDSGMIGNVKRAASKLAGLYMQMVTEELAAVDEPVDDYFDDPREGLIVQGIRFAFRVHQFAGGFDPVTTAIFEQLSHAVAAIMDKRNVND